MDFEHNIRTSFRKAKKDVENVRSWVYTLINDHESLKKSTNEWVVFLETENKELRVSIEQLQKRVEDLEIVIRN